LLFRSENIALSLIIFEAAIMSGQFDVIIIGSGLAGLSCGSILAVNKKKVMVLEKQGKPGGYASGFSRGNYNFDASLHMICGVGQGDRLYPFFENCKISETVEFEERKYLMRAVFPEHDISIPSGDIKQTQKILATAFPQENQGIDDYLKEIERLYDDTVNFLLSKTPLWQLLPVFPIKFKTLFHDRKKTVKQLLDSYIKADKVKALLFANWGFYGLPPSRANMIAAIANASYLVDGAYYPLGGSQAIPNALVNTITSNGGEIHLNEEVDSIIIDKGKAVGVTSKVGKKYFGTVIVSNTSAKATFQNLIPAPVLPEKFNQKIEGMEPSTSCVLVYLGLDDSYQYSRNESEIIVLDTYDLEQDYQWAIDGEVGKASFLITVLPKNSTHKQFTALIHQCAAFNSWKKFEADYNQGRKEDYNSAKDQVASILIKRADKILPELSKHIESIEIATPLTLKKFTGNSNGALYGWANTTTQFMPMDRLTKIPIKNLYLSSAWTFPGEGQAAVVACGYRLARQLLNNTSHSPEKEGGEK
jgi:all-trans-retinol 13,14-reductase